MILEIRKYGDPVLRAKGRRIGEITDEIREVAENMLDTMHAANGVGLAAQQIGERMQLAIIDVTGVRDRPSALFVNGEEVALSEWMPLVLVNPRIELGTEREIGVEGCLSFPEISEEISRAVRVNASAQLLDGRRVEFEATGLLARALQHEVDHLHGVLFIDRMNSATKAGLSGRLKRLQREANV